MKYLFLITLFFTATLVSHAQIKPLPKATNRVINMSDRTKLPVSTNLLPSKDVTVVIDSIADHSTATKSDVEIYYSIVNSGVADIDIKNITIQSFINGAPAGGSGMPEQVFANSSSILHSGQKWNDRNYNSGLGFKVTIMRLSDITQPLLVNRTYNYSLLADAGNIIAESNENNNTANISIAGHFVPLSTDLAISNLLVKYNTVKKNYDVSCTIGNIGTTDVDLNALKYWDCVNGTSYMGYVIPIVLGNMIQANCGVSACGYSNRLDIHGTSNIIRPGQVVTATGIVYDYHGACGGPQVFTYVLDPDNKTGDQNLNNNTVVASIPPQR